LNTVARRIIFVLSCASDTVIQTEI
jgi:hypothetical protein